MSREEALLLAVQIASPGEAWGATIDRAIHFLNFVSPPPAPKPAPDSGPVPRDEKRDAA